MRSGDVGWELVGAGKSEWPELKMEVNNNMMVVITLAVIPLVVAQLVVVLGEQHDDDGGCVGVVVGLC